MSIDKITGIALGDLNNISGRSSNGISSFSGVTWPTSSSGHVTSGLMLFIDGGNSSSYPGTGTTAYDLTSNNYDGTLLNNVAYDSSGYFDFDGNDDRINFGTLSDFNFSIDDSFTMEVWYKTDSENEYQIFLSRMAASAPYEGWEFALGPSYDRNEIALAMRSGIPNPTNGKIQSSYSTNGNFNKNTWYQAAVVYDGATSAHPSSATYYQNGYALNTAVALNDSFSGSDLDISMDMEIGARPTLNPAGAFHKNIAIVRIYDRALSATEVQTNYDNDKSTFGLS